MADAGRAPLSLRGEGLGVRGADEGWALSGKRPAATLTPVPSPQGRGERRQRSRRKKSSAVLLIQGAAPLSRRGEGLGVRGADDAWRAIRQAPRRRPQPCPLSAEERGPPALMGVARNGRRGRHVRAEIGGHAPASSKSRFSRNNCGIAHGPRANSQQRRNGSSGGTCGGALRFMERISADRSRWVAASWISALSRQGSWLRSMAGSIPAIPSRVTIRRAHRSWRGGALPYCASAIRKCFERSISSLRRFTRILPRHALKNLPR